MSRRNRAQPTYRAALREIGYQNHGYVAVADAMEAGVPRVELRKIAARAGLEHVAYGLYRIPDIPTSPEDQFAEAALRAGDGAFLRADSVLALLGLADVNPRKIKVGVPKRVRRDTPEWMEITRAPDTAKVTHYNGIPIQRAGDAILECRGLVPGDRLRAAAARARAEGWLTTKEWNLLTEELAHEL